MSTTLKAVGGVVVGWFVLLGVLALIAPWTEDGIGWTEGLIQNGWMAWTPSTMLFFLIIAGLLALFTALALTRPETPRIGILGIETTRGDRLFISLLGSAFICIGWLAAFGAPLWGGLGVAAVWWALVFFLV
ncbi:MAG: DUF2160 family membrane protein [Pseudomonadota bacterium]